MSKPNRAERIINFLESRYPGWVPAIELEPVGGRQGWRTAVSIARKMLREREGRWDEADDPIPNRQQYMTDARGERWILSSYRIQKRGESAQTPKNENSLALDTGVEGSEHGDDPREVPIEKASHNLNEPWGLR